MKIFPGVISFLHGQYVCPFGRGILASFVHRDKMKDVFP